MSGAATALDIPCTLGEFLGEVDPFLALDVGGDDVELPGDVEEVIAEPSGLEGVGDVVEQAIVREDSWGGRGASE